MCSWRASSRPGRNGPSSSASWTTSGRRRSSPSKAPGAQPALRHPHCAPRRDGRLLGVRTRRGVQADRRPHRGVRRARGDESHSARRRSPLRRRPPRLRASTLCVADLAGHTGVGAPRQGTDGLRAGLCVRRSVTLRDIELRDIHEKNADAQKGSMALVAPWEDWSRHDRGRRDGGRCFALTPLTPRESREHGWRWRPGLRPRHAIETERRPGSRRHRRR